MKRSAKKEKAAPYEPNLKSIKVENGRVDMKFSDPEGVLQWLVSEMVKLFQGKGAINFCSWVMCDKKSGQWYEFIMQKKLGKTPSELKAEWEDRAIEAEKLLKETLQRLNEGFQIDRSLENRIKEFLGDNIE